MATSAAYAYPLLLTVVIATSLPAQARLSSLDRNADQRAYGLSHAWRADTTSTVDVLAVHPDSIERSHRTRDTAIGAIAGAAVGVFLGDRIYHSDFNGGASRGRFYFAYGAIGALIGAVVGRALSVGGR